MRNHPKVSNCLTVSGRSFNWLASSITLFQLPETIVYAGLPGYITNLLPLLFRYQFPALPQGASHGRTFSLSVLRGLVGGESDCWAWPGIPRLCWQQGQISFREEDLLLRQSSGRFWSRRGCCWAWLKKCSSFRRLPQTRLKSFAHDLKATHWLFVVDLVHPV